MGIKFKRQKPIGGYIVDFVAVEEKLIIEVDGSQHLEAQDYDTERTLYLEACGFRVLRFWNNDCLGDMDNVLKRISEEFPSPITGRGCP
jgi:very-short-patch-repair endonuclease